MRQMALGWLVLLTAAIASGQQGAPLEKFQSTDIFLTSYKGASVADPAAYHNSQAGKDFESELQSDDDERYCMQAPQLTRSVGVWKGAVEPSYWIRTHARPTEAEAYASEHGQKHRQDSVLVFEAVADGPDAEYVFTWKEQPQIGIVFEAAKKAGFDGATIAGSKLIVVDVKAAKKANAADLAKALGATLETNRGRVRFLDAGDMEKALRLYDAFPHSCPTH